MHGVECGSCPFERAVGVDACHSVGWTCRRVLMTDVGCGWHRPAVPPRDVPHPHLMSYHESSWSDSMA